MDKALFEAIGQQAVGGQNARVIPIPGAAHRFLLQSPSGLLSEREVTPPPREHQARSLQTVLELAKQHSLFAPPTVPLKVDAGALPAVAIWYSRNRVVALLDDATRRDRIYLPLEASPQLKKLAELERTATLLTQREIIFLLRTLFHDCLGRCGDLLGVLRTAKIKRSEDGLATVQHGKSSVGRSMQAELTGLASIPEYLVLDVPLFASVFAYRGQIHCALEIDVATERFQILPLPKQIELAISEAEEAIGEEIASAVRDDDIAVRHGEP